MRPVTLATSAKAPALTPSDALLRSALEKLGVRVDVQVWDRIAPSNEIVCVRSTWDYHHRPDDFRQWVTSWRSRPGLLWNAPETILWNMDKIYLRSLDAQGIAIPETMFFAAQVPPDLSMAQANALVVKPRISATALGTYRVDHRMPLTADQMAPLVRAGSMVQRFVPEILEEGELSLMFFGGRYSHAVRKRAAAGDFRVQSDFGGTVAVHRASAQERRFAERVLACIPAPWVYARVDVVQSREGLLLMELELIEPELFLTWTPQAAASFAGELAARAAAG
jgi:glutathione synthase/RimK-type ligase-like ATP-grasp enzyme